MTTERWQEIKEIFESALDCAPAERLLLLDQACKGDAELRAEVESLLQEHDKAGLFIEEPLFPNSPVRAILNDESTKAERIIGGRFKLVRPLGRGGMGEVFLARDLRLDRHVAVKMLAAGEIHNHFEREVRAISRLNHPHICTFFDLVTEDLHNYLVMEYLEGETLAEKLQHGPLVLTDVLRFGIQISEALAHAHARGITHRDLKPSNVIITASGIKLLDFGLAKVHSSGLEGGTSIATGTLTAAGMIIGTLPYMAPEQLEGKPTDAGTDIFALGTLLYEMATGKKAFQSRSQASLIGAILHGKPVPIATLQPSAAPVLDDIVAKCLAKARGDRWQSALDVRSELERLLRLKSRSAKLWWTLGRPRRHWFVLVLLVLLLSLGGILAIVVRTSAMNPNVPKYHPLTFDRGTVYNARFTKDGDTIVYSGAWGREQMKVFSLRTNYPDSHPLDLPTARLLSVSVRDELAILIHPEYIGHTEFVGALSSVSMSGGLPRPILDNVMDADWAPNGQNMAVVHEIGGKSRLEYPIGSVLYETAGWISSPRFSPKGDLIAFFDHPVRWDDRGAVAMVTLAGHKTMLSDGWGSEHGLTWSPNGDEIWVGGSIDRQRRAVYAVSKSGQRRVVLRVPGDMTIYDISKAGKLLITHDQWQFNMIGSLQREPERDLSWTGATSAKDLSANGKMLLFVEWGELATMLGHDPRNYLACVRATDGSPAVILGEGEPLALSPDGKQVVAVVHLSNQLLILPTGSGQSKIFTFPNLALQNAAAWFPQSARVLFAAAEPGRGVRLYTVDVRDSIARPRLLNNVPEGSMISANCISPDERWIAATDPGKRVALYSTGNDTVRVLPSAVRGEIPVRWSGDGQSLFVLDTLHVPARVSRIQIMTGEREPIKELMPADPAGITAVRNVVMTPDGLRFVYTCKRLLSEMYWAEN